MSIDFVRFNEQSCCYPGCNDDNVVYVRDHPVFIIPSVARSSRGVVRAGIARRDEDGTRFFGEGAARVVSDITQYELFMALGTGCVCVCVRPE